MKERERERQMTLHRKLPKTIHYASFSIKWGKTNSSLHTCQFLSLLVWLFVNSTTAAVSNKQINSYIFLFIKFQSIILSQNLIVKLKICCCCCRRRDQHLPCRIRSSLLLAEPLCKEGTPTPSLSEERDLKQKHECEFFFYVVISWEIVMQTSWSMENKEENNKENKTDKENKKKQETRNARFLWPAPEQ